MAVKLFLGGLSPATTQNMLEEHFKIFGALEEATVMYKGTKSRGFGFVSFKSASAAEKASAGPHVIDGKVVDIKLAVPKEEIQVNKVFVGGLPHGLESSEMIKYFSQFGTVVDGTILVDKRTNRARGFGFVRFLKSSSVEVVMKHYNKHTIDGKWIEVKRAVPEIDMTMETPPKTKKKQIPTETPAASAATPTPAISAVPMLVPDADLIAQIAASEYALGQRLAAQYFSELSFQAGFCNGLGLSDTAAVDPLVLAHLQAAQAMAAPPTLAPELIQVAVAMPLAPVQVVPPELIQMAATIPLAPVPLTMAAAAEAPLAPPQKSKKKKNKKGKARANKAQADAAQGDAADMRARVAAKFAAASLSKAMCTGTHTPAAETGTHTPAIGAPPGLDGLVVFEDPAQPAASVGPMELGGRSPLAPRNTPMPSPFVDGKPTGGIAPSGIDWDAISSLIHG